jgi:hypothetical protein
LASFVTQQSIVIARHHRSGAIGVIVVTRPRHISHTA